MLEDDYLFGAVCNSTSVGRILTLSPELVDMSDGKFEVFLIRASKDIQELHKCIVALQTRKYECNMITFCSATVVKFSASPSMAWSLDGEKADGADKICIENLHRRIRLLK